MKIDGVEEALTKAREEITAEMHSAVDAVQEAITTRLDYVLDQSTDHRQGVDLELKKTSALTYQLYTITRDEFRNVASAINELHETSQRQVSKMVMMIWGLVAVNITMAITLLVHSI